MLSRSECSASFEENDVESDVTSEMGDSTHLDNDIPAALFNKIKEEIDR